MSRSVDLTALKDAIFDGRLDIWTDSNGYIHIYNKRSKRMIEVAATQEMEYDPEADNEYI